MPFRPEHSLLRVEPRALHTIDTSSVEDLFGMWSVFSKTSHAMQDGKRLENLSWRLWNREVFCCAPQSHPSIAPAPRRPTVPALSSSLDSASSEDEGYVITSANTTSRASHAPPSLHRSHTTESIDSKLARGREKHLTPTDLEKMVISIKDSQGLEPIELPLYTTAARVTEIPSIDVSQSLSNLHLSSSQCSRPSQSTTPHAPIPHPLELSASTVDTAVSDASAVSQMVGSQESSSTERSAHSIVRGFVPGGAPSSYRSQTSLAAAAQPTVVLEASRVQHKKKGPVFTIGTSSGEEESSLESHMHRSVLTNSLRIPSDQSSLKRQPSSKIEILVGKATALRHSPVFESDDEDDEVSESAIEDDDDSSDWEDSDDQSGPSSVNEKDLFQRVDSRPTLTSRRSLLTTLMHEPERAKALAAAASRSTPAMRRSRGATPNGPSVATSPVMGSQLYLPVPGQEFPEMQRSKPIIMTTSNFHQQLALSPRTTRRNMLSTELTESLRKNLLWERQHKSTGNLAALKRRHTSNDVKNLRQHPEPGPVLSAHNGPTNLTNDYFHAGLGEYHAKGW